MAKPESPGHETEQEIRFSRTFDDRWQEVLDGTAEGINHCDDRKGVGPANRAGRKS